MTRLMGTRIFIVLWVCCSVAKGPGKRWWGFDCLEIKISRGDGKELFLKMVRNGRVEWPTFVRVPLQ